MSKLHPVKLGPNIDTYALALNHNQIIAGARNGVGTVTLANGATTTTLYDGTITPVSVITLTPQTADAVATTNVYIDMTSVPMAGGKVTIHHTNPGATDATFGYTVTT